MSHTLTRRNVSAIAKLDLHGLGHARRIDAIAKALGYDTGAALMSILRQGEDDAPSGRDASSRDGPITIVAAFGSQAVSRLADNEPLRDEYDNIEGMITEVTFATKAERDAYLKGMEDADGWMDMMVVADSSCEPDHAYFKDSAQDPDLSFADWHDAGIRLEEAEEQRRELMEEYFSDPVIGNVVEEADAEDDMRQPEDSPASRPAPVIGYQVESRSGAENWGNRASFEILDLDTALADLRTALAQDSDNWRLLIIRKGDVEEPTFV